MECCACNEEKLSQEFIFDNLNEKCEHAPLICMKCALKAFQSNGKCPCKECNLSISSSVDVTSSLAQYKLIMERMFPSNIADCDEKINDDEDDVKKDQTGKSTENVVSVVTFTGEKFIIPISLATETVAKLKSKITERQNIAREKQKLIFKEEELEDDFRKLCDYGVQPNSTIYMIVLMYTIPSDFDHVVFDLCWGFPKGRVDYLDASCLVFSGRTNIAVFNYAKKQAEKPGLFTLLKRLVGLDTSIDMKKSIQHSGNILDKTTGQGHHTINVYLKQIPQEVTHIFFTLSASNSPSISHYPNPRLNFYEAKNKETNLCNTCFKHAINSQAVIMCSVSKKGNNWNIYRSGQPTTGNVDNYIPIVTTIKQLIGNGI